MEQTPPPPASDEEWVPSWHTGREEDEDVALGSGPPPPPAAAPEPPTPSRRRVHPLTLAVTGVILAVGTASVVIAASFVFSVVRGGNLERMVPNDVGALATVNLNPSAAQKVDLLRLSKKFPDLSNQKDVDQRLTDALKPYGLDWKKDVRPWVGSEIAIAPTGAGAKSNGVILVDARPDQQAKAAAVLGVLKSGPQGSKMIWRVADHDGVKVNVGTEQGSTWVLAYFDRTVVLGSSEKLVDEVIDTDHGKHARLTSDPEYQAITKRLPDDRLVTVYVSGKYVRDNVKGARDGSRSRATGTQVPVPAVDTASISEGLSVYKAFAFSLSARPDGLAADFESDVDASKLTAEQRRQLKQSHHGSGAMSWMPRNAVGSYSLDNLDSLLKVATAQLAKVSPDAQKYLDDYGFTGSNGILANLTGQFAFEVTPGQHSIDGAAAIGTRDPSGIVNLISRCVCGKVTAPVPVTTYRDIQVLKVGTVVYGTSGDYLIAGSSLQEVERAIDAHDDHRALTGDATFKAAHAYVVSSPDATAYVNVQGALAAIESLAGPKSTFPVDAKKWAALKAVMLTSHTDSSGSSSARLFLLIT